MSKDILNNQKNIQISTELFSRLCNFHILGNQDELQATIIRNELQTKLDSIQRRIDYKPKEGKNAV